ncbi:MAG: nitrate- and nitrite sensing domain-containing protein [Flavobacteriales bacterium]
MQWRFADLPVRTKFMVTLGIPVLGMVLLIGKQVDGSIKRRNVMSYINEQSGLIGLYANVLHELQKEGALSVGYLTGQAVNPMKLSIQYAHSDAAITVLSDRVRAKDPAIPESMPFDGLGILRQRVTGRQTDARAASRAYRAMDSALLDELGRIGKLALDPETKDRMYAHLRLLNAKEALSAVRDRLSIGYSDDHLRDDEMAELSEQVSAYETNMLLFERDAPPEVLGTYRDVFQGPDVNFMRSLIGTVKERRSLDSGIAPREWWELSLLSLDKLKEVEDHSLSLILENTASNSSGATVRLLIVLAALIGVVGAVMVMGFVILRGVRNTVNEVGHAARYLAMGDISAKVPVNTTDEIGQMALSFNDMIDNIRSLASSAESIGKGDYNTTVKVRGPQDVLGIALSRMKENLKAARLRDDEQTSALQSEKAKLEVANERIHVLIKEMHHRVKNNLQVVASLLRLQAGTIADERLQEAFQQSQSRVTSMALIHEKLYKGDELTTLDVGLYIHELFSELVRMNDVHDRIRYNTDIDVGLAFDLNTMVPLGLLLNELITNSFKHAFRGRNEGLIVLALHRAENDSFDLAYTDDGVGMPIEKMQTDGATLGVTLIESLVEQLNGRMTVDGSSGGTRYHIRFKHL